MSKKIQIAVDGHSSCGKSTFARAIADRLAYLYIDSGAMYRAVTLAMLEAGVENPADMTATDLTDFLQRTEVAFTSPRPGEQPEVTLNGRPVGLAIREQRVADMVSQVAAIPQVRSAMVAIQQSIGRGGGVVMDGRDIGTVVFPHAELKIFMTATPRIRAQRRYDEMVAKGLPADFEAIYSNLVTRDRIDQSRECSPLRQADDAILLDNSSMTIQEQMDWVLPIIQNIVDLAV